MDKILPISTKQKKKSLIIMEVLMSLKRFLSLAGITKQEHVQIAGIKVPRNFLLWFLIGSNTALIFMESVVCVKFSAIGIEAMLVPLHLIFAFVSVHLIFLSLAWKRAQIVELLDYLEAVIIYSLVASLFHSIFNFARPHLNDLERRSISFILDPVHTHCSYL